VDNSELAIEPLNSEDYPQAVEIYRHSRHYLADIYGQRPEDIGLAMVTKEAAEAKSHNALFCAIRLKATEQMVGVVTYQPEGYQGQASQAWLALLMIAKPFQRRGDGAMACRIIEEKIYKNPGVEAIKLGVLTNNPAAMSFWQSMGYRNTGHRRPDQESGHEVIIMEKKRAGQVFTTHKLKYN
jgi:RimJ/RimL family protein N-acetyltransferase